MRPVTNWKAASVAAAVLDDEDSSARAPEARYTAGYWGGAKEDKGSHNYVYKYPGYHILQTPVWSLMRGFLGASRPLSLILHLKLCFGLWHSGWLLMASQYHDLLPRSFYELIQ